MKNTASWAIVIVHIGAAERKTQETEKAFEKKRDTTHAGADLEKLRA